MATVDPTASLIPSAAQPLPAHMRRLYRAFVTPASSSDPERTFYVEAASHKAAARKIAGTVTALAYDVKLSEAEEAVYNVHSASELVHSGLSSDFEARLFECGWSGESVCSWVEAPVFLVRDPAPLMRAWARIVERELAASA